MVTVLVIYWLGTRANRRTVGLLAALFLAVAFLHVRDAHYGVPDVATTFFVSLAVLFCVIASQKHSGSYLGVAAASAGYAIATKWSVWPIGIPLLIAFVHHFWWRTRRITAPPSRQLLGMLAIALCFAAGFTVGGFQLLIKPATYLEYALRSTGGRQGFGVWQIDTVSGWEFYLRPCSMAWMSFS
jgi:4-amino-4-deoxy-L-arabinose transferase-like glycosyltransferase